MSTAGLRTTDEIVNFEMPRWEGVGSLSFWMVLEGIVLLNCVVYTL